MRLSRKILRVEGLERVRFLNDLLSIEIEEGMELRYGALLTPQGKIMSDIFAWSEEGAIGLDLPESEYESVKARLAMYKLRADVQLVDDPRPVGQIAGSGDPRGDVGERVYGEFEDWDEASYLRARIRACVPEFGVDFHANQAYLREWRFEEMGGVNYKKGCFVGQEVAARMRHKSELLKSVMRVRGDQALETGVNVQSGEKNIGEILSAQGKEALAFLRLKNLNADGLRAGDVALNLEN